MIVHKVTKFCDGAVCLLHNLKCTLPAKNVLKLLVVRQYRNLPKIGPTVIDVDVYAGFPKK